MITARAIQKIDRLLTFLSYNPESGEFIWVKKRKGHTLAGAKAGTKHSKGYITIRFDGVDYLAHRLAWAIVNGDLSETSQIDHINGNRSDNRISNLRLASHYQNRWNSKPRASSKSGIKGVRNRRGKWEARIRIGGKEIWLGSHDTPEKAKAAYDEAANRYYGEFSTK